MEKEQHSVDELFRTVLKDQEMAPPADAWYNIQKELDSEKRLALIWILRAVAAAIILLVTFASGYYIANFKNKTAITANKSSFEEQRIPIQIQPSEKQHVQRNAPIKQENKGFSVKEFAKPFQSNSHSLIAVEKEKPDLQPTNNALVVGEDSRLIYLMPLQIILLSDGGTHPGISALEVQSDWTNELAGEEIVLDDLDSGNVTNGFPERWSLGGQISPLYAFRETSLSGANMMAANKNAASSGPNESGIISYSGGMNVEFKASKRLSVSSGLYYSRMGQNIGSNSASLAYTSSSVQADIFRSDYFGGNSIQNSTGKLNKSNSNLNNIANSLITSGQSVSLLQSMDFLELPLMLRYKLIDRKVGFHILGGLSTSFLVANKLVLEDPSGKQDYGTTNGLNTFNYTGTLGLGLDYSFSKKIHFNLEPAFKYYINSINSSGNIESHPYSYGIYTGMCYTF
jgi:Outer membrane protein beta-barrel domain